jgi:uncharacterized membrane protein YsdA (DUF1294 family)
MTSHVNDAHSLQALQHRYGEQYRWLLLLLGGSVGVSLCAIVLEWRLGAVGMCHLSDGDVHTRLQAFRETFWCLAVLTVLVLWPAWPLGAAHHRQG